MNWETNCLQGNELLVGLLTSLYLAVMSCNHYKEY